MQLAKVLWSLCKGEFEPGDKFDTDEGVMIKVEPGRVVIRLGDEEGSLSLPNSGLCKVVQD
jgi:hypothetical protein